MVSTPAHLPVTQEAAGSSPVAPANSSTRTRYLCQNVSGQHYFRIAHGSGIDVIAAFGDANPKYMTHTRLLVSARTN